MLHWESPEGVRACRKDSSSICFRVGRRLSGNAQSSLLIGGEVEREFKGHGDRKGERRTKGEWQDGRNQTGNKGMKEREFRRGGGLGARRGIRSRLFRAFIDMKGRGKGRTEKKKRDLKDLQHFDDLIECLEGSSLDLPISPPPRLIPLLA
mmetsp:Transcript_40249/g.79379  ORF Transcript_40249/g.79379 Transcript_40249/m.79379 type:complete len:151 (-) Transcript_40249:303-755(-)